VQVPDVSYTRSGDVSIAYQVVGEGPTDLVLLPFLSNLYTLWQAPKFADFGFRLAAGTVLATILFTDLVGSTPRAAELGDREWRTVLERHNDLVRTELARFRGVELDTAGDGFFASFDGPARAIGCAKEIVERLPELGLDVRAGIHIGECERVGEKLAGLAVSVGARVSAAAEAGEVLVSQTVKDLVAGSGIQFEDRGSHELKGVPGEWRLYAVDSA
jgi:class 3 adenylate cyclase